MTDNNKELKDSTLFSKIVQRFYPYALTDLKGCTQGRCCSDVTSGSPAAIQYRTYTKAVPEGLILYSLHIILYTLHVYAFPPLQLPVICRLLTAAEPTFRKL